MYRLCTAVDVQEIARGRSEISDDQLAAIDDFWIPAATGAIAAFCHRDFDKQERTRKVTVLQHRQVIYIPDPPIDSTQTIELWESHTAPRVYDATTLLVLNQHYLVGEEEGAIEKLGGYFCPGRNAIQHHMTSGLVTGHGENVPDDLRMMAAEQAFLFFYHRDQFGISGRSLEGGSTSIAAITLPTPLKIML